MNEEYTPDIVSIVDEDGKEHIFEELDRIETDDGRYVALLPLPESPDKITEGDDELIILKVEEENGETYLCPRSAPRLKRDSLRCLILKRKNK